METKDFIHGKVDWFKNPILEPDAFKEGNMANISPTIKINISTNPDIVEEIMLGASCSSEELAAYKALFQEFRDIFAWSTDKHITDVLIEPMERVNFEYFRDNTGVVHISVHCKRK